MTLTPDDIRVPTPREIKVGAQDVHRWIQDMGWDVPGGRIEPRWAEAMKFVSSFLELGEYASIGGSAMFLDAVVSPEQRNGYLAQVEDEVRHTNQLGYLNGNVFAITTDLLGKRRRDRRGQGRRRRRGTRKDRDHVSPLVQAARHAHRSVPSYRNRTG